MTISPTSTSPHSAATEGPDAATPAPTPSEGSDLPDGVTPPKQARSRKSFERMVAAARRLMADGGLDAVTVQDVIRLSEVGAGSFYARFESREALIAYLHADLWRDAEQWWVDFFAPERWREVPVDVVVGEVVRVLVRAHFDREPALRAFWTRAVRRPAERVMEHAAEWDAAFVERFAAILLARRDQIGHPEPDRACRLAAFQLLATLRAHLFFPDSLSLGRPFTLQDVILELGRSVLAYLEGPRAPSTYADLLRGSAAIPPL